MTGLSAGVLAATLAGAACLAVNPASDRVVAADLAPASAAFSILAPDTVVAWAPAPGVERVFRVAELRRLAARLGATPAPEKDLCVTRPVAPLDGARILAALRKQLPGAGIRILDFSRQPAPEGALEFPLSGWRRGSPYWNGFVRYAGGRRFAVWARVEARVTAPAVVAAEDLRPGVPIAAAQLRLETQTRDGAPEAGLARNIEDAVGLQPLRLIRAGSALPAAQLAAPPEVARGDLVRVAVSSGTAHLELEGRAESAGSKGQRIAVRNPLSKRLFFARVESRGRAVVDRLDKETP